MAKAIAVEVSPVQLRVGHLQREARESEGPPEAPLVARQLAVRPDVEVGVSNLVSPS